ncbi:hypothetical protein [Streptosporangium carneum]|uniref:Uncharacterized protein n=1 Tax=Streptosporangium carneum TaxID=47481 RepID=A0A9W6I2Q9_9ACTN|nr:hypothetical protein [Streptosporangium carneum]GLK10597.1 hypothetical protein GCM10017600_40030 [Streptosporangium carneum]
MRGQDARRALAAVTVALATCSVSGCVSPAWDDHDYALKAGATAQAAASSVELVRLAVQGEHDLTTAYLKVLLTDAAESLGSVNDQFGGVQPPSDASDRLRSQVTDLTSQAEDEVEDLLIEVRRGGIEQPDEAARTLERLGSELRRLGEAHR